MQHDRLRSVTPLSTTSGFMAMMFDRISYLIRNDEIYSFESLIDLDLDNRQGFCSGQMHLSGHDIPVYCFDDELNPLMEIPAERSLCVVLRGFNYGLVCRETRLLNMDGIIVHDLPVCMRQPSMPFSGICLIKSNTITIQNTAMLLSTAAMGNYIKRINNVLGEVRP